MNVTLLVDALGPQLSGIGRYTWELCRRLSAQPTIDRVSYFANGEQVKDPASLLNGRASVNGTMLPDWVRRRLVARQLRNGLVHGPNYFLPLNVETGVITVHDLSVLRHPDTHPADRIRAFEEHFASSLSRARHVITDTETVRRELIEHFSLRSESVSAVPLGVDLAFRPFDRDELHPVMSHYGLAAGGYGLSVAALEPRKKTLELIAAWRRLQPATRERYPLVLAGSPGWRNDDLHAAIRDAEQEGWLKHLGFVEEAVLPQLYAGARLFAYPSIYEGFGLPPIEAMASGAPVLVSDRSCIPEVCGDAAAYTDPDDPAGFTSAIAQALEDESGRTAMIARGLQRAQQFSWDRCAAETVAAYRTALSS